MSPRKLAIIERDRMAKYRARVALSHSVFMRTDLGEIYKPRFPKWKTISAVMLWKLKTTFKLWFT